MLEPFEGLDWPLTKYIREVPLWGVRGAQEEEEEHNWPLLPSLLYCKEDCEANSDMSKEDLPTPVAM